MPNWAVHIEVANRLIKSIPVLDRDAFILANLAPDIENGHIIKDCENKIDSKESHYKYDSGIGRDLCNINKFISEKENVLNNDVVVGYLCHLLTDRYWNSVVCSTNFIYVKGEVVGVRGNNIEQIGNRSDCNKVKQKDFKNYAKTLNPEFRVSLAGCSKKSLDVFSSIFNIPDKDLLKTINVLNNSILKPDRSDIKTELHTIAEYDDILSNSVKYVLKILYDYMVV